MMKWLCVFISTIAICMVLTGCTDNSEDITSISSKYCHMLVVENTKNGKILQDSDTGVLYLWYKDGSQYGQTLTPLYNADGTLKNIDDYS